MIRRQHLNTMIMLIASLALVAPLAHASKHSSKHASKMPQKTLLPRPKAQMTLNLLLKHAQINKLYPKAKITLAKEPRVSNPRTDPLAYQVLVNNKPTKIFLTTSTLNPRATLRLFKKPKFEEQKVNLGDKSKALRGYEATRALKREIRAHVLSDMARGLK